MSKESNAAPPQADYGKYRRIISGLILAMATVGTTWVMVSVGVTIYRRSRIEPGTSRVSQTATTAELESCRAEVADIALGLEKHVESFHHLLGRYDPDDAQRWGEQGLLWRRSWADVGRRCRLADRKLPGKPPRQPGSGLSRSIRLRRMSIIFTADASYD